MRATLRQSDPSLEADSRTCSVGSRSSGLPALRLCSWQSQRRRRRDREQERPEVPLPLVSGPPYAALVVLFGIASAVSRDIDDWYETREAAEAALAEILTDEPDFIGLVWVEAVTLQQGAN